MPLNPEREKARQQRKKDIAAQQIQQFEDELSAHELNLARLAAAGQPIDDAEKSIDIIVQAIETTEAEIENTEAEIGKL